MAIESKYLARFKKAAAAGGFDGLRGDRLIVEVLPKEEIKTQGGLYIESSLKNVRSDTAENQATLAIVLATGSGYEDEDGETVPLEFEPGNILLVSAMGLKLYSSFPGVQDFVKNEVALTRDSEVHLSWPSVEAYEKYKQAINAN